MGPYTKPHLRYIRYRSGPELCRFGSSFSWYVLAFYWPRPKKMKCEWLSRLKFLQCICSEYLPDCHKQCGHAGYEKTYSPRIFSDLVASNTQYFCSPPSLLGHMLGDVSSCIFPLLCQILTTEQPPELLCYIKGAVPKLHFKWLERKHPGVN